MHLTCLVIVPLLAVAATGEDPFDAGQVYRFSGTLALQRDDPDQRSLKRFTLTVAALKRGADGGQVLWQLDETGRGGWSWLDRVGLVEIDAGGLPTGKTLPTLLYERDDGNSRVPVHWPLLVAPKPLAEGTTWAEGDRQFEVRQQETLDDRPTWKIVVSDRRGYRRTLWVDAQSGLIRKLVERLFLGQGQQYSVEMNLTDRSRFSDAQRQAAGQFAAALRKLNADLQRTQGSQSTELSSEQLAKLEQALPQLRQLKPPAPLDRLLQSAAGDVARQGQRAGSVAELVKQFSGKEAPEFRLEGLGGAALSSGDLKGQVTVLHFWDYREAPLKEPYGQVGYLDFLHKRHKDAGLAVYGVAVNADFADERRRDAAIRSTSRLRSFFNLGYGVLLDGGTALRAFGDPTSIDAALPLYVVIGRDGKIAHYHVGLHEQRADRGLYQLDEVVSQLLKAR